MIEVTASLAGIIVGAICTVMVSTTAVSLIEAILGPPQETISNKKPVF